MEGAHMVRGQHYPQQTQQAQLPSAGFQWGPHMLRNCAASMKLEAELRLLVFHSQLLQKYLLSM
jgi:hypothetical protein